MNHTEAPKKTKAIPLAACPFMTVAITGHLVHRLTNNLNFFIRGSQSSPGAGALSFRNLSEIFSSCPFSKTFSWERSTYAHLQVQAFMASAHMNSCRTFCPYA